MKVYRYLTLSTALLLAPAVSHHAMAEDTDSTEAFQVRQAALLEMFADEGIDANEDGALSRREIGAFFGVEGRKAGARGRGHGMHKGRGKPGMMRGHGPHGDSVGGILRHMERLDAETAPARFPLERHLEADVDGDGVLSDAEWSAFAVVARERFLGELLNVAPEADANEDGAIDEAELLQLRSDHAERVRAHVIERRPEADIDGDGVLSDEEWASVKGSHPKGVGCGKHRGGGHGGGCGKR